MRPQSSVRLGGEGSEERGAGSWDPLHLEWYRCGRGGRREIPIASLGSEKLKEVPLY